MRSTWTKQTLTKTPVLALSRKTGHCTMDLDTCDTQIGCVFHQQQTDGPDRLNSYWPTTPNDSQKELMKMHKECFSVARVVLLFRPYLEKVFSPSQTGHESLKWLLKMVEAPGKLVWSRLRLLDFAFDVVQWAGIKHQVADALSKISTLGADKFTLREEVSVSNINAEKFKIVINFKAAKEGEEVEECSKMNKDLLPCLPKVFELYNKVQKLELDIRDLHKCISG